MTKWLYLADKASSEWRVPFNETYYPHQIEEYWHRLKKGEDTASIIDSLESEE
jgi:hypothetical protein